tara:strand:+ start:144 stop:284 length:141 start_codon:yes stop_codon:yes gene_type:complete
MLNEIITLLKYSKGGTDNIDIAKGKNKLPSSFTEVYKKFKEGLNGS